MTIINITFEGDEGEQIYTTSSQDTWQHKAIANHGPHRRKKYCHYVTLVSRCDGLNLPLETVFNNDNPECKMKIVFIVGQKMIILSNKEDLQLTYSCHPPGSLIFDLITFSASEEDVQLKSSDGKSFNINEYLLKSRSKVFRAMLAHGTKEAQEKVIQFEDLSSSVLEDLVIFLKTDQVPHLSENAIELGFAADKFDLPKLLNLVESHLKSHITEANYDMVGQLAILTKSGVLLTALGQACSLSPRRNWLTFDNFHLPEVLVWYPANSDLKVAHLPF